MDKTVACSRPLPLGPIELGDTTLRFVHHIQGAEFAEGTVAYLSTAVDPVGADLIESLPASVGLIANLGVGYDNIDLAAAAARGIAVSNTPVVTEDTADLAFALILAACRRVGEGERYLRAGKWAQNGPPPLGVRVHGATLGLVGFGAIGQAVARRAAGFGMQVLYHSRTPNPDAAHATGARHCEDLDAMLRQCDIVSLHAPLTEATRGLFDAARLARLQKGAVLINTARGALVDEDALAAALNSGALAAAGLDVFSDEPEVPAALLACETAVLTPHIGSATGTCRTDIVQRGVANIANWLAKGVPIDPVTLPRAAA